MKRILQRHPTWSAIVFGCTASILICVLFGRGDIGHAFVSVIVVLIGTCLLALSGLLQRLSKQQDRPLMAAFFPIIRVVGILFICQIISIPLGYSLYRSDLQNAQQFANDLIPLVEEFREHNGYYPENIEIILQTQLKHEPYLLRHQERYYKGDVEGFNFCIFKTADLGNILIYDSDTGQWVDRSTLSTVYGLTCN